MKEEKAYFIQRLFAWIIDIIIVALITSIITYPFINNKNVTKLNDEVTKITEKYVNGDLKTNTYISQTIDVNYELAKETGFSNIIQIIMLVLYFIVFQVYKNGQTIGKKIMKIRIVKNDNSELTMNDLIIRNLINNAILVNIIVSVVTLISKNIYYYTSSTLEIVQFLIIITTVFMIIIRKDGRGLSDMIAKTKVVRIEE